jgi:thiamine biosynthesis lipoprotein
MKKILSILLVCSLAISVFTSCANSNNKFYKKTNIIMGTPVTLSAYGTDAQKAVEESLKRLEEIDNMASTTITTSDIYKINNEAGISYVKVHPEIMKIIQTSIEYAKLTEGAFDITVAPIINLWGIGTDKERLPSEEEIKAKLPLVGYDKISIREEDSSVMLLKQGMALDLGGIAKGFAADEVLKIYKKYKIQDGLINLGASSIYALGKNGENKPWAIGVTNPRNEKSDNYLGILRLSNEALSTSGDYERYFIKDGKRYHHIINPKTGYPTDNGVMSDTILIGDKTSDCSMLADLLTTAVFILGPEKGMKFVEGLPNVSCEITTNDYKVYTSEGFKTRLESLNKDFKYGN